LNAGFTGVNNLAQVFPMERLVFLREVNNNMYGVTTYFFSKIITEMPGNIIFPLL
jgi:hypothetical protein